MANRKFVPTDDTIAKERKVLELRRAGVTLDVIAEQVGYTNRSAAYKALKRALARTLQQPADELRDLEADRLDRLQAAIWAKAMNGDLRAIDRVLLIAERRARLLGLDHADGLAERRARLDEQDATLILATIWRVFDRVGLTPTQLALVERVLPEELEAVAERGDVDPDVIDAEEVLEPEPHRPPEALATPHNHTTSTTEPAKGPR